jgi:hypothetical protein
MNNLGSPKNSQVGIQTTPPHKRWPRRFFLAVPPHAWNNTLNDTLLSVPYGNKALTFCTPA